MTSIKVYRSGPAEIGNHSDAIVEAWSEYDIHKPEGRSGRLESIYASPSLKGVLRWVRSNHMSHYSNAEYDLNTYEVTVDPANIYVYNVELIDRFHSYDGILEHQAKEYWNSGILLSEWETVSAERNLDPSNWEVLVPVANVRKSVKVSDKRLVLSGPEWSGDDLKQMLKNRKEFVKWCNWEPATAA